MTSLLPHRAWAAKRPHMTFLADPHPSEALAGIIRGSRGKAERLGLDGEHGTALAMSLTEARMTVQRFLNVVGWEGYLWDLALYMHLKAFAFLGGEEHRMGIAHDSPWNVAHGSRLRVSDLDGIPSAGFISFEGSTDEILSPTTMDEAPFGGVSFVVTTVSDDPAMDDVPPVGDTDEERMKSFRGLPGTRDQLMIVIWPKANDKPFSSVEPFGMTVGIDLVEPGANLLELAERQIEQLEAMPELRPGMPKGPGHLRIAGYRDILAKTFAALTTIRDEPGEQEWQDGIPPYLTKRLEGHGSDKTERRLAERGFVRERVHPSSTAPDRRDTVRLPAIRARAAGRIADLDAATVSAGFPVAEGRMSFVAGASDMVARMTRGAGWLVEAAPADRDRLASAEGCAELMQSHREHADRLAHSDTRLSQEQRVELTRSIHDVLARPLATADPANPWMFRGVEEDEVLVTVAMIEAMLDDRTVPLPRDVMLGLMVNRTMSFAAFDPKDPMTMPTKPIQLANGMVADGDRLVDTKTGRTRRIVPSQRRR